MRNPVPGDDGGPRLGPEQPVADQAHVGIELGAPLAGLIFEVAMDAMIASGRRQLAEASPGLFRCEGAFVH